MSLIRININNREFTADDGSTILDIALKNGIEIPNLCYDKRTKPYGSCGLCVVEVDGNPKLVRACSTKAEDGMIIKTDTARTMAARKTALSLLSSDHRGDCRPPCVVACPAHTDCQGYVGLIANGQYDEAIKLVKNVIPIPTSIGRVCPHPCETACRRSNVDEPVAIADLKRFLGDIDIAKGTFIPDMKAPTGNKVAVVGSGPAGIACAYFLAIKGHSVVMYEDKPYPGGMLRYGIPEYRLPKAMLDAEINTLTKMGVKIECNVKLGEDISIPYLRKTYDAVYIAIGAWASMDLGCTGQDMNGVMGGIEFLRKATLAEPIHLGRNVIVVGGGNTAMDVARTAIRLGAESVQVLYRRTREEMPAEDIEVEEAEEEGVEFRYLVAPVEIIGDGTRAKAVRCQKMKLGEPDKSGRRSPVPIEGEEITFDADLVISAIGQRVNAESVKELELTKRGAIAASANTFETSLTGVFAGGEAVTGPKIAIEAIAQGKNSADVIDSYLNGQIVPSAYPALIEQKDLTAKDFEDHAKKERQHLKVVPAKERKVSFSVISETFNEEKAIKEASRCLECGCHDYFECKLVSYIKKYDIDTQKIHGAKHKREEKQIHPFILRNPDKCILCGQCYRVCDEVMGITALGLEGRGFDSKVIPEFNLPLEESACISCGQCIDVCPTGALIEREAVKKQVPVSFKNTDSVCSYCGVGCDLVLQTKGDLVFKALPDKTREQGLLCARGRFGINHINDDRRLLKPIVRGRDNEVEVSFDEALALIAKKLQLIQGQYGNNSIALISSPRFTNEEAFVMRKIAALLRTGYIGTMSEDSSDGVGSVLGYNASTNSYDELYSTDLIISIGNIAENHPVMGVKIKAAAEKRAKLVSISPEKTRMQEWANISLNIDNNMEFLKSFIKTLIDMDFVNEEKLQHTSCNYEDLKNYVKDAAENKAAAKIAKLYGEARKAIIVVDDDTVSEDALKLLADIAVISGKIGKPHRGIIIVRSKNNSQGFIDMGISTTSKQLLEGIENGTIKAAVILGEDLAKADAGIAQTLNKLQFTAVFDMYMTKTAEMAKVVVPIGSSAESEGTFTRSDRKIQHVNSAVKPFVGMTNLEIFSKLFANLGGKFRNIVQVREKLSFEIPAYSGLYLADRDYETVYTPNSRNNVPGEQVLYTSEFKTEDKKAHITLPESDVMFKERKLYDTLEISFKESMDENCLKF